MGSEPPLRLLTFSTLYPNSVMPRHGVFVEQRLRHLMASGVAESTVVAPVPWFPFRSAGFGAYSQFAKVPRREKWHGVDLHHPRYIRIPKVGMSLVPSAIARSALRAIERIRSQGYDFDLIDAHYFYPDGVAAVMVARKLKKPVIITARGTDINLIPQYATPRRQIQWAASQSDAMITVCQALKDALVDLDVDARKIEVLRNGVDLELFSPVGRANARQTLGLEPTAKIMLSVGYLIDRKGHDIAIRALCELDDVILLIAGDGEKRQFLEQVAVDAGVADRVRFLGSMPHERLRYYFSAADALVLASSREGWANVLLESMACGTPVIASNVWGTPEVVAEMAAGVLMDERTPAALAAAWRELQENYPVTEATRKYAEQFSWDATTEGQLSLMHKVLRLHSEESARE